MKPYLAIMRVHCFVGPVKIHIVLAHAVPVALEYIAPLHLLANIFGLEMMQHPQAYSRVLPAGALIKITAQRNFGYIESPCA